MSRKAMTALKAIVPIIVALCSIFLIAGYATNPELHASTVASLDAKTKDVLELTAASTAASAAITLLPGDAATPIADKIADLTSYFLLVISAIYLEKYLVTITGYAVFYVLVPAACLVCTVNAFMRDEGLRQISRKLFLFAAALFLVIPVSVKVSDLIEKTNASPVQTAIEATVESTGEFSAASGNEEGEEAKGFIGGIIDKVSSGINGMTKNAEQVLNNLIDALAVLIVTSCVIPILVLLFFIWLVKILIGAEIRLPRPRHRRRPEQPEERE